MALVTTAVATSPWWLTPAINTTGIGLLMLNDYIKRNKINLNPFKQELNIDDIDWMSRDKSDTSNHPLGALVSNNDSADQSLPNTPTIIAGSAFPPPSNNEDPNKNISGQARWTALSELINKLTLEKGNSPVDIDATKEGLKKYGFDENFELDVNNPNKDGSIPVVRSEAGQKADAFLDAKSAWLAKTANSPAQQSGAWDSDEGRDQLWQTHLANQQWRKDKGRSFTHGDFLN